jgi:hypothetical protein
MSSSRRLLPFAFVGLFFLINAFAAHVLEVMHAIPQVGADGGTIKIVVY